MASSTSTTTPLKHAFESRVIDVRSPKSDINALILDYLTMEGYPHAAAKFSQEAKLHSEIEGSSVKVRQQIQGCIHKGQILDAIDALNELDPEILDKDPVLHFALLRLHLVELIRNCRGGDIGPALKFATSHLSPRAPTNPDFLQDLENTMALLIFPHDTLAPDLARLLHPNLRREVADKVNRAILYKEAERREAAIRHLVLMRNWSERSCKLPERLDLGLASDCSESSDDHLMENGHEPMITT